MKDYEKIAKTAFVYDKKQQELAERLRNKFKKVIAASKGEYPPLYLRNRADFKRLKKEVDEFAEKEFFGPTIYGFLQAFEKTGETPLKKYYFDLSNYFKNIAGKINYRKKVKSLAKGLKIKEEKVLNDYKRLLLEYVFTDEIKEVPKKFFGGVVPFNLEFDGEKNPLLIAVISPLSNIDEMTKQIREAYFENFFSEDRERLKESKHDNIAMYLIRKKKEGIKYDIAIGEYACQYPEEFPDPDSVEFDEKLDDLNKNAALIVHQFRKSLPKLD